ncbi:MAG: hypothetical protein PHW52_02865 [Candidatus Pacebacteria bacterium]|nr:hypothetical protein [Candidatus Paceibacterota bacterium]
MNFEHSSEVSESSENENLEEMEQSEGELSFEERQHLVEKWKKDVIDGKFNIDDGQISNQRLKEILSESLMEDIAELSNEWGIELDDSLSDEEYIEKMRVQVSGLAKKCRIDTHWDSWPKKMREDEGFNCVGATLLGINALNGKGIESYYGNPWGHVVNIAKLSNGKWMYVDLRNNIVKEIYPEMISLEGNSVLRIDDENIDYKLIPIHDNSIAVGSIIGNLSGLEAEKGSEEEQDIYQNIKQKLFPEFTEIEEAGEMQVERERVESIQEAEEGARNYLRELSEERIREVVREATIKKEAIRNSILEASVLEGCSDELQEFLRLMVTGLNSIDKKEIREEAISRFLSRLSKF